MEAILSNRESPSHHHIKRDGFSHINRDDNDGGRAIFPPKWRNWSFHVTPEMTLLSGSTELINSFKYQGTVEAQKVSLASFHLEGKANQWWQWLHRAYKEDGRVVTLAIFEEEPWARFRPSEREDFDETLSWVW